VQYITPKFTFASRLIYFASILLSRQIKLRELRIEEYKEKCLLEAFIEGENSGTEDVNCRIPVNEYKCICYLDLK
jgi:hypothetical protein